MVDTPYDLIPQEDDLLIQEAANEEGVAKRDICTVDLQVIRVMAFKGTGVCSENCRKLRDGEPIRKYGAVAP